MCIFEKRVNKKNLYDKRFDLYERAVTVEGSEIYVSIEKLKSPWVSTKIKEALNLVSFNLKDVSYN